MVVVAVIAVIPTSSQAAVLTVTRIRQIQHVRPLHRLPKNNYVRMEVNPTQMVTVLHPAITMFIVKTREEVNRAAAIVMAMANLRHVRTVHNRIAAANVPLRVRKINLKPKRVQTGL
jgi:hypothetical protein